MGLTLTPPLHTTSVVSVDAAEFLPALRRHLDRHGFPMVQIAQARDEIFYASRLDPEHPWCSGQWPR